MAGSWVLLFGAGMAGGAIAAEYGASAGPLLLVAVHGGAAALGLAVAGGSARRRIAAAVVVALAAFGTGHATLAHELVRAGKAWTEERRAVLLDAEVDEVTRLAAVDRIVLDDLRVVGGRRLPGRLEIFEDRHDEESSAARPVALASRPPGCRVRAWVRVTPIASRRNPGTADPRWRAARSGLGLRGRLVHPALHEPISVGCRLAGWRLIRERARSRLQEAGRGGALLAALALGDRSGLSLPLRDQIGSLGLSHLLAVSGLHLAWVGVLGFLAGQAGARLVQRLGRLEDRRGAGLVGAGLAATAYLFASGAGVPVRRAWILLAVLLVAAARGRPVAGVHALALAACAVLFVEPAALFAPGAQLSFVATAALVLAPVGDGAETAWRASLRMTSTAMLATAPLVAWHFGQASTWGLATNLVAVPWVGMVLLPAALAASAWAALAPSGALVDLAVVLAEGSVVAVESVAGRVAALETPLPAASRPGGWTCGAMAMIAMGVLRTPQLRTRMAGVVAVAAVAAWTPSFPGLRGPRVVVLDVGQGDAIVVQGPEGGLLVDGGAALAGRFDLGRQVVVPALAALGVRRLALVVATHGDSDHRGGLPAVIEGLPCDELWLPEGAHRDRAFDALREVALARGVRVRERAADPRSDRIAGFDVEVLWPPPGETMPSRNAGSLALRIRRGAWSLLAPGDLPKREETRLLARGRALRSDVLVVGHHGSDTSTGQAWLEAIRPGDAVVSAPRHSRFGLPDRAVLDRLRAVGARLHWTGRDGAVELEPPAPSAGGRSSVDRPDRAVHVGRFVRRKEREDPRDLLGRASAAERRVALHELRVDAFRDVDPDVHVGRDEARRDPVDADARAHVLHGQRLDHVRDGALGHRVGRGVGLPAQ